MIDDEKLLECMRAHEYLYNKASLGYRLQGKKEAAWAKVARDLGATEEQCSRRWQSLRERYSRELKKMDAPSGSADSMTDTWPLFNSMSFLKEFVKPRPARSTTNVLVKTPTLPMTPVSPASPTFMDSPVFDFTQEMDCSQPTPAQTLAPTPTTSKKRQRHDSDGDVEFKEVCHMYKDMCKYRMDQTGSETLRAFGQMIISLIAEMSDKKQMKAIQFVTNAVIVIKHEPEE